MLERPMTDLDALRPCLNCDTPLQGPFCHHCGQKDQPTRIRLGQLLHEVLHDLLHVDAKVLGTFWLLVSRPGLLAQEYLQGRRTRHMPPFRTYVVTSFIAFFLFALLPSARLQVNPEGRGAAVRVRLEASEQPEATPGPKAGPAWARELPRRIYRAIEEPEHFKHLFLSSLSKALFALMPLFAGLLFLLHVRGRTYFMEHMVVSLYHHAFTFLVILGLTGLAYLPGEGWGTLPGVLLLLLPPVHLAITLQRLYYRGWTRSILKAALASAVYGLVVGAALVGLIVWSLPR
jgi:hypothetical protein